MTKKEAFGLALIGALAVFSVTTILARTAFGITLGEDENVLSLLQFVWILAAIVSVVGLMALK